MRAATKSSTLIAGLLLAAAPLTASAQGWAGQTRELLTPYGEYLLIGAGVTDFTKDATRNLFDTGGSWDVRLGFGSRTYLGAEVAYVGAALNGSGSGPDLAMNGAEGVLRVNYPFFTSGWLLEPFAFGGIGYSHLSLSHAPSGAKTSDDIGVVPFGAGLTVAYGRILLDARFTYRTAFSENLAVGTSQAALNLERYAVGASLGWEF
jgi:hypothetical protein